SKTIKGVCELNWSREHFPKDVGIVKEIRGQTSEERVKRARVEVDPNKPSGSNDHIEMPQDSDDEEDENLDAAFISDGESEDEIKTQATGGCKSSQASNDVCQFRPTSVSQDLNMNSDAKEILLRLISLRFTQGRSHFSTTLYLTKYGYADDHPGSLSSTSLSSSRLPDHHS
ncbi:hypothetical protein PSHT_12918, partial [Puccinia striiformis]